MMKNRLCEKLRNDEMVFGMFVAELYTPMLGMLMDAAKCDFVILDQEHGVYDLTHQHGVIGGFRGGVCTPLLRIPTIQRSYIQPPLDLGFGGLVVPSVESPEQVRECVKLMKFSPQGDRGLSLSRPHTEFLSVDRNAFTDEANRETMLIIQIETRRGLDRLDDIIAEPGIDLVFVGCADLSLSLGIKNDASSGPLRDALEMVMTQCSKRHIPTGTNISKKNLVDDYREQGLRFVSCSTDIRAFLGGIKNTMAPLQNSNES